MPCSGRWILSGELGPAWGARACAALGPPPATPRPRAAVARPVLRRVGPGLRSAAAHGMRANDNPADARMLRHAGLPALPGGRKQPSLAWPRAPGRPDGG